MAPSMISKLAPFPRPFWTINAVELFERGAYYGMLGALALFITLPAAKGGLGISAGTTGILLAIQFPLLYFVPLVSAALADKFGYKTMLFTSFSLLMAGYATLALAQNFGNILLGVTLYGLGAGLFKPMPAATVSHTTSLEDRNFGFAIYYWLINLGAFIFPTIMAWAFGTNYRLFFWLSGALSLLNFLIVLTMWKNLKPHDTTVKVLGALKRLGELASHPRFVVLLVIYCGFWFMYAITTSFMPVYMVEYGLIPQVWAPLVSISLNSLAIITLGPILGKTTSKVPSLALMVVGISIYVLGYVTVGFTSVAWLFVVGVVLYSIGEFLTHPSFLSYCTKIAPPDRVAVFLAFGFIPIGIGQFSGTLAGGYIYAWAQRLGQPHLFWAIISSMGLVTIAALLLYNRSMAKSLAPIEEPAPKPRRSFLAGPAAAALALLLVPALVVAGALTPAPSTVQAQSVGLGGIVAGLVQVDLAAVTGETKAKDTTWTNVTLPANASGAAVFTLTWKDEAPSDAAHSNQPDTFKLHVKAANGTMVGMSDAVANPQGGEGKIELKVDGIAPGDYSVGVEAVSCGAQTAGAGPLTIPLAQTQTNDPGNAWSLATKTQARA